MIKCGLKEIKEGEFTDDMETVAYIWQEEKWKHDPYLHRHSRYQLTLVQDGYQYFHIEQKIYFVPQYHVICIPSAIAHRITSDSENIRLTALLFKDSPATEFYQKVHVFRAPAVLIEMINYASKWNQDLTDDASKISFLNAILDNLPELYKENSNLEIPIPTDERLIPICHHINTHYKYDFKLDEYAEMANMSIRNLQRIFKLETGLSIQKYVQVTRILKSIELIDKNKFTLTEVAYQVGYHSLSAFLSSYKSLMQASPK